MTLQVSSFQIKANCPFKAITISLFLLIYVGIMINVMVREYRTYLDDYPMCHFSLGDFIRRGRFYICLILGVVFITFVCLVVSLMAISIQ